MRGRKSSLQSAAKDTYQFIRSNAVKWRNSTQKLSILFILSSLIAGCASQPAEAPAPAPATVPPQTESIPRQELFNLLDAADAAIEADHLTYPEEGSAVSIYRGILAREPSQADALHGLERIVERYVDLAMRALDRRQFASARSMLARARLILPDHPSIEPSAAQIRLIMSADRTVLKLDREALTRRAASVAEPLSHFASGATLTCRFVISARNDAEGRWIYQQLKGSYAGRLRAQVRRQSPPAVERLCFKE